MLFFFLLCCDKAFATAGWRGPNSSLKFSNSDLDLFQPTTALLFFFLSSKRYSDCVPSFHSSFSDSFFVLFFFLIFLFRSVLLYGNSIDDWKCFLTQNKFDGIPTRTTLNENIKKYLVLFTWFSQYHFD